MAHRITASKKAEMNLTKSGGRKVTRNTPGAAAFYQKDPQILRNHWVHYRVHCQLKCRSNRPSIFTEEGHLWLSVFFHYYIQTGLIISSIATFGIL